jgi:hypothetical protein
MQFMFEGRFEVFQTVRKTACAALCFFYKLNKREPANEKNVPYKSSSEDLVDKGDFCKAEIYFLFCVIWADCVRIKEPSREV